MIVFLSGLKSVFRECLAIPFRSFLHHQPRPASHIDTTLTHLTCQIDFTQNNSKPTRHNIHINHYLAPHNRKQHQNRHFKIRLKTHIPTKTKHPFFQTMRQPIKSIRSTKSQNASFTLHKCKNNTFQMVHFDIFVLWRAVAPLLSNDFLNKCEIANWHVCCVTESPSDAGCDRQVSAD
ncbi:MAG: hypothetical protein JWN70_3587 [Planctomycetaceae bacterium]|nr:hypothetical protein [Planctomycetaceae bacterium]